MQIYKRAIQWLRILIMFVPACCTQSAVEVSYDASARPGAMSAGERETNGYRNHCVQ